MIRPTVPADIEALVEITHGTGVFKPIEIEALREVLADYFALNHAHGHFCITKLDGERIVGFAYYAPTPMTDRSWHLYWIAVRTGEQARGLGAHLLTHVEDHIRKLNGRALFIETSGLPNYDKTRRFYVKQGYDQEATLRDFYAAGDHQVIFRKLLS